MLRIGLRDRMLRAPLKAYIEHLLTFNIGTYKPPR